MQDADVVVVGAGLAGLTCAVELTRAGLDVVVVEAADAVGGRIRSDRVDGFIVDRGFQLINPAYPELPRHVDVPALGLQSFGAGVVAVEETGTLKLGHPLHEIGLLPATARAAARRPIETVALARWLTPLVLGSHQPRLAAALARRSPHTRGAGLDAAGVNGTFRRVLDRFLDGVVLEDNGSTAEAFALLLVRSFALGTPGLPREGMEALPRQLAAHLRSPVRMNARVARVEAGRVTLSDDANLTTRAVVVATEASDASALIGLDTPAARGVVTAWWASDDDPSDGSDLLRVDARRAKAGPVINCAVVSNAAPSYAPPGQHLIQASALLSAGVSPSESALRRHAAELLGARAASWDLVALHEVPRALPSQTTPFVDRRSVALAPGVWICGDHRDTASIQGALVSGRRTATAVRAALL